MFEIYPELSNISPRLSYRSSNVIAVLFIVVKIKAALIPIEFTAWLLLIPHTVFEHLYKPTTDTKTRKNRDVANRELYWIRGGCSVGSYLSVAEFLTICASDHSRLIFLCNLWSFFTAENSKGEGKLCATRLFH